VPTKEISVKLRILEQADSSLEILCDEYVCTEIESVSDIFDAQVELMNKFPSHNVLATLDDLGQAEYTSVHADMSHDLSAIEGYDLSSVDHSAFEDGEHIGYLSTKSEFFIKKNNFISKIESINFADVCKHGISIDSNEMDVLESIHKKPVQYIDNQIHLKVVPVCTTPLTISAFPNGYFACDLNPFENYAVAEYFRKNYDYELFGLGASLIGFKRNRQLDNYSFVRLAKDISKMYNRGDDKATVERFLVLVRNYNYLFLKYVEYLEA